MHGADVSSSMREIARRNGLDCIELMDGKCLPFEDRSVDAVFTSTVLQHNDDEHAASLLAEMARVAAPRCTYSKTPRQYRYVTGGRTGCGGRPGTAPGSGRSDTSSPCSAGCR